MIQIILSSEEVENIKSLLTNALYDLRGYHNKEERPEIDPAIAKIKDAGEILGFVI